MLYVEIAMVFVLTLVNGLLAMSELAVVSSRPARLQALETGNVRGAGSALRAGANPGGFLSTVQIGITLVGVLSGAFSGATLGERLADWLTAAGMPDGLGRDRGATAGGRRWSPSFADRRRTGAQADRLAQSRAHRRRASLRQ